MNKEQKEFIAKNFKNTELGFQRIKRNLELSKYSNSELETILLNIILSTHLSEIKKIGKNYYFTCDKNNAVLTINSTSLTIITAKKIKADGVIRSEH